MKVTSVARSETHAVHVESGINSLRPHRQTVTPRPISSWSFSPLRTLGFFGLLLGVRGQLFPAQIELSSLNGTDGFVLNGASADDQSGISVSSAGDVNGDSVADLLIGAPLADPATGREDAGKSYVVFGRKSAVSSVVSVSTGTYTSTQKPSPSPMEVTVLWSPIVSSTKVIQAPASSSGPDGTVIALVTTVVGLALSMCGGLGLFLRHKLKTSEKEKSIPVRELVYQEAQEQLMPVYATIPTADAQRESHYSDWPRQEESIYEELELREGSHYVQNIADIMPDHESASESTS